MDENGNSIGTVNRAVEITNISVPHSIQNLFQGTWYNISVRSVNWFDKVNPVAGPVLVDQTGEKLKVISMCCEFCLRQWLYLRDRNIF